MIPLVLVSTWWITPTSSERCVRHTRNVSPAHVSKERATSGQAMWLFFLVCLRILQSWGSLGRKGGPNRARRTPRKQRELQGPLTSSHHLVLGICFDPNFCHYQGLELAFGPHPNLASALAPHIKPDFLGGEKWKMF